MSCKILPLLLVILSTTLSHARPGTLSYSNGEHLEGDITLTPGYTLTLHDSQKPLSVPLDAIEEIRFAPEREEMVRAWRFPEAGQARKEQWGEPYPMRHLEAALLLRNGERWIGHLHTLPLYVTATGATKKVVILAKQRGQPGETLESLTYPLSIRFSDTGAATAATARLTVSPDPDAAADLCAITRGSLVRLPGKRPAAGQPFAIDSPLGAPLFVAIRNGDALTAAWTAATEPEADKAARQAVADARDFFDARTVLGVSREGDDVYALVDLSRAGHTTLGGTATQPWRLEVWRFKWDPDTRRVMLAARNWFFRGITPSGKPREAVRVATNLAWTVEETGSAPHAKVQPLMEETRR